MSRRAASRAATLTAILAFAGMIGLIGVRVARNLNVPGRPLEERYGLQDYRDNFYYPVVAVLDGRNPYDFEDYRARYPIARPLPPYSPISFLVHLPLAALPYPIAEWAYFGVSAALLLAVAYLGLAAAGAEVTAARLFGIAAALLGTRPAHMTLFLGQCTVLVVVGCGIALHRGRSAPFAAALGIALACVKPTYGLPLLVLILLRRDGRAFLYGGALAGGLAAALALPPIRAASGLLPFLQSVQHSMAVVATDPAFDAPTSIIRVDLAGSLGRAVGLRTSAGFELLIGALVMALAGLALARLDRVERDPAVRPIGGGLLVLALLLSMYHQAYDTLLLALPAIALVFGSDAAWSGIPRRERAVLLGLMAVPAGNYLATHTLMKALAPHRAAWLLITSANGAAIAAAFVLWLALAFRTGRTGSPSRTG
jgi:hypothetical protein